MLYYTQLYSREIRQMVRALLTSGYFFFFGFTYFYVGKAYLGFTEKKKVPCVAE